MDTLELTPEQVAKIEENKRKAQERLQQRKAQEKQKEALELQLQLSEELDKSIEVSQLCHFIKPDGAKCTSMTVDKEILEAFGEAICISCKKGTTSYDLITKNECVSAYLIPQDALKWMKFCTRNNPLQPGWKPMKLYLRKDAEQFAKDRFGSIEAMEMEKKLREEQKFQRGLLKTQNILAAVTDEYRSQIGSSVLTAQPLEEQHLPPSKKRKTVAKKKDNSDVSYFKTLAQSLLKGDNQS